MIGDEGRRGVDDILWPPAPEPVAGRQRRRSVLLPRPYDFPTLDRMQDEKIAALKQYLATRSEKRE